MTFEKTIIFRPAFDKRDPDPSKNYGVHGVEVSFVLKGPKGVTHFLIITDWHLPHVQKEKDIVLKLRPFDLQPMGADICYHSPKPLYKGQDVCTQNCEFLNGKPCYYDGTSLGASDFIPTFLAGGSDAAWKMLEARYHETFDKKT